MMKLQNCVSNYLFHLKSPKMNPENGFSMKFRLRYVFEKNILIELTKSY